MNDPRGFLLSLFETGVAAAHPESCLPPALNELLADRSLPAGRTVVLGAGKAAAAMAREVERRWPAERPLEGLVVTRRGHGLACARIEVVEAAHPVPDEAGLAATRRTLELARGLGADDLALCLLSGGGSALWTAPAPGLALEDMRRVTRSLLDAGARIDDLNAVRKHLSAVKGGRLAVAAHPARVVTFAISDVAGDDPSVIASGPTVGDGSTFLEVRRVLARHGVVPPPAVLRHLDRAEAAGDETPRPGDPRLARSSFRLLASGRTALEAAAERSRKAGVEAVVLSDRLEGEAGAVARGLAAWLRQLERSVASERPTAYLSGGEVTVAVGSGRDGPAGVGGPNGELALAVLAEDHLAQGQVWMLSADTDGFDGAGAAAGALVTPTSTSRAAALGLDSRDFLARHDSHRFFEALGDLVITGPTRTNVNDFRALLLEPERALQ